MGGVLNACGAGSTIGNALTRRRIAGVNVVEEPAK